MNERVGGFPEGIKNRAPQILYNSGPLKDFVIFFFCHVVIYHYLTGSIPRVKSCLFEIHGKTSLDLNSDGIASEMKSQEDSHL